MYVVAIPVLPISLLSRSLRLPYLDGRGIFLVDIQNHEEVERRTFLPFLS